MKKFTWPIFVFSILLIGGGVYAFFKVASVASLLMSLSFGTILLISAVYIYKEKIPAMYIATLCIFTLHIFFLYRFFKTLKLMPAGFFVLLTTAIGAPLLAHLTRYVKERAYR